MRIRSAYCVVALLIAVMLLGAGALAEPLPLPPVAHPRLMVRSDEIPELLSRYHSVEALRNAINAHAEGEWVKMPFPEAQTVIAALRTGGTVGPSAEHVMDAMGTYRNVFEANAFLYLIDPQNNWQNGKYAIELASEVLNAAVTSGRSFTIYKESNACGRMLFGAAIVYDWCHGIDAFLPGGTPRVFSESIQATYRSHVLDLSNKLEIGIPTSSTGAVTGHSSESPILRNLLGIAIAFWDPEQPVEDQMYGKVVDWIIRFVKPARDFAYAAGMTYQGPDYGLVRHSADLWATWIFRKMGHPELFSSDQKNVLYWHLYGRRPDGQMLRDGDIFASGYVRPGQWWLYRDSFLLAAHYHRDGYLKDELIRERNDYTVEPGKPEEIPTSLNGIGPALELIIRDSDVVPLSHSKLPLSCYFPYPIGTMIARTGWDDRVDPQSDTALVEMKVGCMKFNNHMHLDSGAFQIYYRGALAIDSGVYQGDENGDNKPESYGSIHDGNYYKQTIAHNCMLAYDPEEQVMWNSQRDNNGGQRWPNLGREPRNLEVLQTQGYTTGEVLAHAIGPDLMTPEFTHIKGDITNAYTSKVSSYKRSFVFLNLGQSNVPAILMVYDWMTTSSASYDKYWLCHAMEEPLVSPDKQQFSINRTGVVGKYGYYSGKLVTSMILPEAENRIVEKVGGPGREFKALIGEKNYPTEPTNTLHTEEPGGWRVQVRPKAESRNDAFFNVMQIMDGSVSPLAVSRVSTSDIEGAMVADRVVTFSKSGSLIDHPISLSFAGNGTMKVLMTDMAPGSWMVRKTGSTVVSTIEVKASSCVLYFSNTSGSYEVAPVSTISLNPIGNRTVPAGSPIQIEVSSEYSGSSTIQYSASGD